LAGGRINHTLKYALEVTQGWKVVADNFFVKISGDGVNHTSIEAAVRELIVPGFWSEERLRAMRGRIPEYRLSKFQDALPEAAVAEMLGGVFIDETGAQATAQRSGLLARTQRSL